MKDSIVDWTTAVKQKSWDEIEEMEMSDYQHIPSSPRTRLDGMIRHDPHTMLIEVLEELDRQGKLDFWLLKHPGVTEFWADYQERLRTRRLYDSALERLRTQFTSEELELLRIKPPSKR